MAPREGPRLFVVKPQQCPCLFLASLLPFLPASHSANPNSENASSSARGNSQRISDFHFSNSEPRAGRLEPLTHHPQSQIDTPKRVGLLVSHRKQKTAHGDYTLDTDAGIW
jgi:hypothetical protein